MNWLLILFCISSFFIGGAISHRPKLKAAFLAAMSLVWLSICIWASVVSEDAMPFLLLSTPYLLGAGSGYELGKREFLSPGARR